MEPQADIALIGLAVMGQNLILNMNDHGFTVVAYNRTVSKVDEFLAKEAKNTDAIGAHSIEEMVGLLKKPRRVMLMVKAGKPVDEFIEQLLPHLEPGDIIIDGGNSLFEDTNRRAQYAESKGLLYIGTGVSGGEEGARHGPSIMTRRGRFRNETISGMEWAATTWVPLASLLRNSSTLATVRLKATTV